MGGNGIFLLMMSCAAMATCMAQYNIYFYRMLVLHGLIICVSELYGKSFVGGLGVYLLFQIVQGICPCLVLVIHLDTSSHKCLVS